jgi:hypothetical protein
MLQFLKHIVLFCSLSLIAIGLGGTMLFAILEKQDTQPVLIQKKIAFFRIDTGKLNIVIAGDSRGEKQIIPKVFEDNFDCNSFNISASANDLISTVYSINEHYNYPNAEIIFVISASSFQINDGALDLGYLSYFGLSKLGNVSKLKLFYGKYSGLFSLINRTIINQVVGKFELTNQSNWRETKGVSLSDGKINNSLPYTDGMLKSHPWYKDISINGYRNELFNEAFSMMGKSKHRFIIIQPPVSKYFRNAIEGSSIETMEYNYSKLLKDKAEDYQNVKILDFFTNDIESLVDSMYYDPQHLNTSGARIFSNELTRFIK